MNQPADIAVPEPLPLREVTTLLVRHFKLSEGLWDLNIELQVAIGSFGPSREKTVPGAMVGVQRIGLSRTAKGSEGPNTVDAGQLAETGGDAAIARAETK